MKPERRLKAAESLPAPGIPQTPRTHFWSYLTKGFKRMANGDEKTLGNIPFPVFVWLMGITIAAVWAFAALNSTVQAMNTAMVLRDGQYARERDEDRKRDADERQKLENKINEQQAYINQFRVEIARVSKGR